MPISSIKCSRVRDIPEQLQKDLLHEFSNHTNPGLAARLRRYRNESAEYYLVYAGTIPLFFFSLQASCIFTEPYCTSSEYILQAEQLAAFYRDNPDATKREAMITVYKNSSNVWDSLYLVDLNDPDTKELSVYNKVCPAVELVEFCKCDSEESKDFWRVLQSEWNNFEQHSAGEFVFFTYIFPILARVSQHIGCKYLLLYAADKNGKLVDYYKTRLHLFAPQNAIVNKPKYDLGCKLLMQELNTLGTVWEVIKDDFDPNRTGTPFVTI